MFNDKNKPVIAEVGITNYKDDESSSGSFTLEWVGRSGFGTIGVFETEEGLYIDTECMGKSFVKAAFDHILNTAKFDTDKEFEVKISNWSKCDEVTSRMEKIRLKESTVTVTSDEAYMKLVQKAHDTGMDVMLKTMNEVRVIFISSNGFTGL